MTPEEQGELADRLIAAELHFRRTGDREFPYVGVVDDAVVLVSLNDFPAEPLHSLYVEGTLLCHLDDWPGSWTKESIAPSVLEPVRDPRVTRLIDELYRAEPDRRWSS